MEQAGSRPETVPDPGLTTGTRSLVFALLLATAGSGPLAGRASADNALDFPSNGQTSSDVRFRFTGSALIPMYPATYVWRVNLRRQAGYYTTFFRGPDGPFTGTGYYGCHPYPDGEPKPSSTAHKWELSIDGQDFVKDANGNSTQLGYGTWRVQAMRAYDNGTEKVHEFFWDLPDTTKVIRTRQARSYGAQEPANPALTFGDAPWALRSERLSGLLRGIQLYAGLLSLPEILAETGKPMGSAEGAAAIWYLNLDPTPSDISDKSGKGHHPSWVSPARPSLWSDGAYIIRPPAGPGPVPALRVVRGVIRFAPAATPWRGGASDVRGRILPLSAPAVTEP